VIFLNRTDLHGIFSKEKPTEFLPGSYVVVKYRSGSLPHVHTFWRGPLKVISNEKKSIYYTI
jgi:hypothetical protein